jgi:hypothetical protein
MINGQTHNIAYFLSGDLSRAVACWAIPNDLAIDTE